MQNSSTQTRRRSRDMPEVELVASISSPESHEEIKTPNEDNQLLDDQPLEVPLYEAPNTQPLTRTRVPVRPNYRGRMNNSIASSFETERESLIQTEEGQLQNIVDDVPADSPKLAIFYFVMYTIFSTYNLIAGKFYRTWYPEMSTFQLLFYRGFSACIVLFLWMGRDTKKQLINNVNSENFAPLTFRIFQGIFSQFIRYYSMTFFSLSMISVIQKLAPVFTVALAYLILAEKLTSIEIVLNIVAILASLLVTVGDHEQHGH